MSEEHIALCAKMMEDITMCAPHELKEKKLAYLRLLQSDDLELANTAALFGCAYLVSAYRR